MNALTMPLTHGVREGEPDDLAAYERRGGYEAFRHAVQEKTPEFVRETVKAAKLKGRGGAGFEAGVKWGFVPQGEGAPKTRYLVCNADEMEPGTFKDRLLLEGDPHMVLEGMMLAAYAISAGEAFLFLRWAYTRAAARMRRAIEEARDAGYLGKDVLGSGYDLEVSLHSSAGRYICGEETALLNALEGRRAIPRAKPPFPPVSGLYGRPTIVQNVETLSCVPHIVRHGAPWFVDLGLHEDSGTKIYGVSGRVKRPGAWERPIGTTAREILDLAGGMWDGHALRGFLPGGASTDFLTTEHLDTPLDFPSVAKAGSRLGTGTLVVLDDRTCPVAMNIRLQRFFARESCGFCTPCREGLPWVERILVALEEGHGEAGDVELLQRHVRFLGPGNTFCALAPGAMEPLGSALSYFGDDFEAHVKQRGCPWRS